VDNVDKLNLIKQTLDKRGVSQTRLAELLGVNLTTVNNWLRRDSIPQKYIDKISMLFNLHISSNKGQAEDIFSTYRESKVLNTKEPLTLTHIDKDNNTSFSIDSILIGQKELDNICFNIVQSTNKYVDIIDTSVDIYCGDGIYYIKYPHKVIPKRIYYNFSNNTYTIIDCVDSTSKIEVLNFNEKLEGKVISRIEIF